MARARRYLWIVAVLAVLAGCTATVPRPDSAGDDPLSPMEGPFGRPVVLETSGDGREPSMAIASDGTIYVCSIRGVGMGTDLWRSTDGGSTFEALGGPAAEGLPPSRSNAGDVGGSDCDLAVDAGGRVYLTQLWAGSASISSSGDRGETWSGIPISQISGTMDRPWVLGGEANEVFVTGTDILGTTAENLVQNVLHGPGEPAAGGIWVVRSTDGGKTFPQQVLAVGNENRFPTNSNLASGAGNLYLFYTKKVGEDRAAHMVAVSKDNGLTWLPKMVAEQTYDSNTCQAYPHYVFPSIAADGKGGVYIAWAWINPTTQRVDLFFAASADGAEHWTAPTLLTDRPGTRAYPRIAAQNDGHVGIAWYETNETFYPQQAPTVADRANCSWGESEADDWFVRYASIQNASSPAPSFTESLAQTEPVHRSRTLDRPFAEALGIALDAHNRAAVAYVSDTKDAPARPMFAMQAPAS